MKQQMKELFDQITMSEECEMRIENMLKENTGKKKFGAKRKVMVAAIAAAVACALPVTAYAASGGDLFSFLSGGGFIFHEVQDDSGIYGSVEFNPDLTTLFTEENGRLYLNVEEMGEKIDLTDKLSETEPYIYSCETSDGAVHYLIIGGTVENYGYAEFIKTPDGEWDGGYSSNAEGQEWYNKGAQELELPWAGLTGSVTYTEAEGADDENGEVTLTPEEGKTVPYNEG